MANTLRIKRRASGAAGAPTSLANAELAFNEVDNTLYYGKGTGGEGGAATSVEAIGGVGAFVALTGTQTVAGDKTFSGTISVPTPTSASHAATKAYVDSASPTLTGGSGISISGSTISADATIARLANPTLTGVPAAPTATSGTSTTQIATTAFVRAEIAALVDSAPETLDTLNELAAALGDDPNFAATVTAELATKLGVNDLIDGGTF